MQQITKALAMGGLTTAKVNVLIGQGDKLQATMNQILTEVKKGVTLLVNQVLFLTSNISLPVFDITLFSPLNLQW